MLFGGGVLTHLADSGNFVDLVWDFEKLQFWMSVLVKWIFLVFPTFFTDYNLVTNIVVFNSTKIISFSRFVEKFLFLQEGESSEDGACV